MYFSKFLTGRIVLSDDGVYIGHGHTLYVQGGGSIAILQYARGLMRHVMITMLTGYKGGHGLMIMGHASGITGRYTTRHSLYILTIGRLGFANGTYGGSIMLLTICNGFRLYASYCGACTTSPHFTTIMQTNGTYGLHTISMGLSELATITNTTTYVRYHIGHVGRNERQNFRIRTTFLVTRRDRGFTIQTSGHAVYGNEGIGQVHDDEEVRQGYTWSTARYTGGQQGAATSAASSFTGRISSGEGDITRFHGNVYRSLSGEGGEGASRLGSEFSGTPGHLRGQDRHECCLVCYLWHHYGGVRGYQDDFFSDPTHGQGWGILPYPHGTIRGRICGQFRYYRRVIGYHSGEFGVRATYPVYHYL